MASEHRRAIYTGRVQGVGFRATTAEIARQFRVGGSVRNLDDGTVEVIAAGEPEELDRFLGAIARRFDGKIRHATISEIPPDSGEPSGFSIRY